MLVLMTWLWGGGASKKRRKRKNVNITLIAEIRYQGHTLKVIQTKERQR